MTQISKLFHFQTLFLTPLIYLFTTSFIFHGYFSLQYYVSDNLILLIIYAFLDT